MRPAILFAFALFALLPAAAQTTPPPAAEPAVHTAADLAQWEAKATEAAKASPTGFGVSIIDTYGNGYTLMVVRLQTGEAECHQFFADEIVLLKGTITLLVGGTMLGEHVIGTRGRPGETLGSSVQGGKEFVLHAGEIAHIPAGIPHWVKVPPGATASYLVFKEK